MNIPGQKKRLNRLGKDLVETSKGIVVDHGAEMFCFGYCTPSMVSFHRIKIYFGITKKWVVKRFGHFPLGRLLEDDPGHAGEIVSWPGNTLELPHKLLHFHVKPALIYNVTISVPHYSQVSSNQRTNSASVLCFFGFFL